MGNLRCSGDIKSEEFALIDLISQLVRTRARDSAHVATGSFRTLSDAITRTRLRTRAQTRIFAFARYSLVLIGTRAQGKMRRNIRNYSRSHSDTFKSNRREYSAAPLARDRWKNSERARGTFKPIMSKINREKIAMFFFLSVNLAARPRD